MSRKMSFQCQTVYDRLSSEKARHNGKGLWWSECLKCLITEPKSFKKDKFSVTYLQWQFVDSNGDYGRPIIDCYDEINQGSINPVTEEETEQLNLENQSNKFLKVEARKDGKPYVRVKKFTIKPKTKDNDGVTLEEDGIPGPEYESLLYKTVELFNEAFTGQMQWYLDNGIIALAGVKRKVDKNAPKPLLVADVKIRWMIHDTISETDTENPLAGQQLANPSTRLQLKHDYIRDCFDDPNDKKTGLLARKTRILDYDTKELALFDDEPVKNTNIHKYLKYGCKFNAKVDFGSVCCSSAGISNPMAVLAIAVKQPEIQDSKYDVFASLFTDSPVKQEEESKPAPEPEPVAEAAPAAVTATTEEIDILDQLKI